MTTILNEMTCGTINFSEGDIHLGGNICVTKEGALYSVSGGLIYDTSVEELPMKYIGNFTIKSDSADQSKRSIAININELDLMLEAVTAINNMITDVESKYKK